MAWSVISFFMRALAKRGLKGFELTRKKQAPLGQPLTS